MMANASSYGKLSELTREKEEKEALLVERRERACAASRMLKGRKPKRDIYLQINLVKHNTPFFDVLKSSVSKRRGENSDLGSY